MNTPTNNVVEMVSFIRRPEGSGATPLLPAADQYWIKQDRPQSAGTLNANVLQRLNPDAELSKFFTLASKAIGQMSACEEALLNKDPLAADDVSMASKITLSELLMYRDLSDAIGLVVFKCFQAASAVKAVTDAPQLPETLKRALQRILASPFMKFEEACDIVAKIEEVASPLNLPGYDELANELIGNAWR